MFRLLNETFRVKGGLGSISLKFRLSFDLYIGLNIKDGKISFCHRWAFEDCTKFNVQMQIIYLKFEFRIEVCRKQIGYYLRKNRIEFFVSYRS